MTEVFSDDYWRDQFRVTEADLDRVAAYITKVGEAQDVASLASRIVRGRLLYGPDTSSQAPMTASIGASVRPWDPTASWQIGERVIIPVYDTKANRHVPAVGYVTEVLPGTVTLHTKRGWTQTPAFARAKPNSDDARKWGNFVSQLIAEGRESSDIDHQAEAIVLEHGIANQVGNALQFDSRFVQLAGRWFLRNLMTSPTAEQLVKLAWMMLGREDLRSVDAVAGLVQPPLSSDAEAFGLFSAMRARPDLFRFEGTSELPVVDLEGSEFLALEAQRYSKEMVSEVTQASRPIWYADLQNTVVRPELHDVPIPNCLDDYLRQQLEQERQVVQISRQVWLPRSAIAGLLDRAYDLLQDSVPRSIEQLLPVCLETLPENAKWHPPFLEDIESTLRTDGRFFLSSHRDLWTTIPPGNLLNNLAYVILWQEHRPLSRQQIVDRAKDLPQKQSLAFELGGDMRFRQTEDGRWMLARWIVINDLATTYLSQSPIPLLAETVLRKVCEAYDISLIDAIFEPEGDPRFVRAPLGKWTCQSPAKIVTGDLLERLIDAARDAPGGVTLEILVEQSLHESPSAYFNLEEVLKRDGRLVCCDDLWYVRERWFYCVTAKDLECIKVYITQGRCPVPSEDLAQICLRRPVCLTDLEQKLADASEFADKGSAGWIVSGLQDEVKRRERVINWPQRSGQYVPEVDPEEFEEEEPSAPPDVSPDKSDGQAKPKSRVHSVTIALAFEDIRDGSILVRARLGSLLNACGRLVALRFVDEKGTGISCWYDTDNRLINEFGDWFKQRELKFGDKVRFSATQQNDKFAVAVVGERNEQVYLEGVRRSHVQNLIDEAKRVKRSYHDLLLEVLDYFSTALYVDDLWALVNYRRTARKGTLSSILSSRPYFVSEGAGHWRFDKEEYARMIQELERKIRKLETANEELQRRNEELTLESSGIESLRRELQELRSGWQKLSDRQRQLEKENQSLDGRVRTAEERAGTAEAAVREITESYNQARDSLAVATRQTEVLNSRLQEQTDAVAALEAEKEQLLRQTAQVTEQFQAASGEQAGLTERIEQLDRALQDATEEISKLREKNQALNENNGQLRHENETWAVQIKEIPVLRSTLGQLQTEFAATRDVLRRSEEETAQLRVGLQSARDRAEESNYAATQLGEEYRKAQASLATAEDEVASLNARISDAEQIIHRSEMQSQELLAANASLQARIDSLKQRESRLHNREASLEEDLRALTAELDRTKQEVLSLESGMAQLMAQKQRAEERLDKLNSEYEYLRDEHARAMTVLDSWTGRLAKWWAVIRARDVPTRPPRAER
jgi:predicted  nucleic acid-binding Zn-ribbon protein